MRTTRSLRAEKSSANPSAVRSVVLAALNATIHGRSESRGGTVGVRAPILREFDNGLQGRQWPSTAAHPPAVPLVSKTG
jgi:hypothetical protein